MPPDPSSRAPFLPGRHMIGIPLPSPASPTARHRGGRRTRAPLFAQRGSRDLWCPQGNSKPDMRVSAGVWRSRWVPHRRRSLGKCGISRQRPVSARFRPLKGASCAQGTQMAQSDAELCDEPRLMRIACVAPKMPTAPGTATACTQRVLGRDGRPRKGRLSSSARQHTQNADSGEQEDCGAYGHCYDREPSPPA